MSLSSETATQEAAVTVIRRRTATREILSFVLIGGLAALAFVALSMLMIGLGTGLPDWIVSAICYALFVGPVYLAHRLISFRSSTPHAVALPRYVAVQLGAVGLASLFSYLCYALIGMPTALAAALVIGLTSSVNFVVLKLWAFAQRC